jgi:hypothetical protein
VIVQKKVMKNIILILLTASIFLSFKQADDTIVRALKTANASQIATYFDKIIDIKFPEKEEIKSIGKNQAGIVLKSFFDENEISGFDLTSQRELGGTMYITGKLLNKDKGHNLSLLLKNKEGRQQIITLRIN